MNPASGYAYGAVVLTMGKRPVELKRALDSLLAQRDVHLDVVVVCNGSKAVDVPEGVRVDLLGENLGIPAGRNAGAELVQGEFIFFLDDDSWLLSDTFLADCATLLRADPTLGMIQPRIIDPERRGEEPRRWIPRIRKGDPARSSEVFSVLETAVVLPRVVFDSTGGWPSEFFYAHEGIELAWRVWDVGRRVEYRADLLVGHPVVAPTRHSEFHYMNARNRVWLARRCLHWPLSWAYVLTWTLHHLVRDLPEHADRVWWNGWFDGWTERPWEGRRRPKLKWSTVATMTRHGRPPIV
ncbi:Glycosyltransferase, GT2 family [Tessaracoccus bendigoensis DSM 12906]|uniref:Glycosyltransferase, GT2 family n=1 Tax=Tessaracoccus bendigoensis DSM 12906 TaxID=1123357 RepID=A0A1M6DK05_9ACTN|nr:glycosyltransferase [Tessaracoccus bendigoensis]SHI73481.1 Glycosyltransferase, GT2 family [Tessaracoccus bendigoensis DSM 12906]